MSSEDLFRYVIRDDGASATEVLQKLLGGGRVIKFISDRAHDATMIDFLFPRYLKHYGPGLLSFSVHENLKAATYSEKSEIPCFDGAFDSSPVAYLALDYLADDETRKIQQHLPQSGKSETTSATPLGDSGHVSFPRENAAGVVPSRSDVSSLDVEFGDKEDTAPDSWLTYFTGVVQSTFGFGGKDQGEGSPGTPACWTSLDNVAATPGASDNGQ
jgi:hypothetical protein